MKPENIKKVWEHYRGFQIRYRIGRSQYIIDAFNKNMNGDFSPSLFINPIESKVHLIVKEYIKCLLEQEALEQAQQEQTTIDTQQKSHNSPSSQGGVRHRREGDKETHPQTQQPQAHKAHRAKAPALKFTKKILGEVSRSDGGVKNRSATEGINTHRNKEKICPSVLLSKIKSPQGHSSPLENYQVIFRRSTPKGGGGQKTISKFLRLSVVSA